MGNEMEYYKVILLLLIGLLNSPIFSQVETLEDCFSRKSNSDLKSLSKKQHREPVDGRFYSQGVNMPAAGMAWQSSFRSFKDVSKIRPKDKQKEKDWVSETCGYSAYAAHDNYIGTMWCEGAPGVGIGEVVMGLADLKDKNYFYILPGRQSKRKFFESYSRPLDIDVHYLVPMEVGTTQSGGKVFSEVLYWSKQSVKLSKDPGHQKIEIQPYKEIMKSIQGNRNIDHPFVMVAIEIKSVIEGKENKEHTCIAEIGNSEDEAFYKKATLRD
ncbi:NADase-type glycan-binding domain-containing protein [Leptospira interrogans]|uniref:NAD glycohydrolase translocation F5/8 type C domain-containing protein n=1 Tax=Leptospira interrogans serovar Bataviae TaxID=312175 RepID=A0AAP9WNS8_LEPIR|nr:hypothetical protein [Leptospira interrogans]QOI51822.1 hypothetical protein Lepto1489_16240 [Leptospira interrogans serovar Bataviae]